MKVIQINSKSKSPKIELANVNRLLNYKGKVFTKNAKLTKTRNNDLSSNLAKKENIFKKIFPHNNNYLHFSSNNCISSNTTNFNNTKTNNFIILENDFNLKEVNFLKQQIKSLIKHNSSTSFQKFNPNFTNIKFIKTNTKVSKDNKNKHKKEYKNNILKKKNNIRNNNIDINSLNKNEKLHINTNYSILSNNSKKENEKLSSKIKKPKNCFNIYNSRPLTLNFSNEFNNLTSYKIMINNKSMKYLSKHTPNYKKKLVLKENSSKKKKKGKSEEKDSKKENIFTDNKKIKESKSYCLLSTHLLKKDKLTNSTSFSPSPIQKNKTRKNTKSKNMSDLRKLNTNKSSIGIKNNNSIERVQINLYNKKNKSKTSVNSNKISERKNSSVKTSENQINVKYFSKIDTRKGNKNLSKKRGIIASQKISPFYSKKISNKNRYTKSKSKNHYNIILDYNTYDKNTENTFKKSKIGGRKENIVIITPEQNHFLAVKQIQNIKKNSGAYG